jgi:hypothetical protein
MAALIVTRIKYRFPRLCTLLLESLIHEGPDVYKFARRNCRKLDSLIWVIRRNFSQKVTGPKFRRINCEIAIFVKNASRELFFDRAPPHNIKHGVHLLWDNQGEVGYPGLAEILGL